MKILLINDYSTPSGGAELLMLSLRDKLRQRGHDARCFSSNAQPLKMNPEADYTCFGTTSSWRTILQTGNFWAVQHLQQVLKTFQPDLVHIFLFLTQLSPLILPLLKDIPSIYYAVWYRAICPIGTKLLPNGVPCQVPFGIPCYQNRCLPLRDWLPLMLQMNLWQKWGNNFNLWTAASKTVQESMLEANFNHVEVVWHGVPQENQRLPLQFPPNIAFAARLVKEKGADILLRAFAQVIAQIPQAQLNLVGEGVERDNLEKRIIELNLTKNVVMHGQMPRNAMEALFSNAWVQVVPSLWAEPFGLITASAMMRGTAVIASATGGSQDIVTEEKTGFLFPPGDVDALATSLLKILQNRELAEKLGYHGRKFALAHLTEDIFVDNFLSLYDRLLHQKL
ncbi:MAG: glycosyltransferase family 4 protein [Microcystis aeruginosa W13-11]|jgi:glycosyltransferase involved in cell wall biosynthesis|nr:glycosyltransferase family 4 protein [Microcystis aeruginosa W13-11]